ncbi:hypothetical protein IV203_010159 [Nitzschia inconspicua]|uniref:Uncharacterized protein n=1 Tax=Nitzschia inconspicua TaxID=303405 RepID=A0A9K3KWQ7_9STRA|nr:hypothetical protein IV203_010159 [Nitzschia inconspicua]
MKFSCVTFGLGLGLVNVVLKKGECATTKSVVQSTRKLRGKPVVHTRTIYHHEDDEWNDHELQPERLVDTSHPQQTIRMRGTGHNGITREFEIDVGVLEEIGGEQYQHHHSNDDRHLGNRVESYVRIRNQNINEHEQEEHPAHASHQPQNAPTNDGVDRRLTDLPQSHDSHHKKKNTFNFDLPTGLDKHYNQTLYEELHNAPFVIYERTFGNPVEGRESSFPVFIVPEWKNSTGIFSGFSRTATPLIFENMQFLLTWDDIVQASSGAHEDLIQFMEDSNFHSTLIIGKALSEDSSHIPFLGLMVSYYQNTMKHILVPFATLDNFFHDTSEQHLLSEDTRHLEHDALHEMLDEERINNSTVHFLSHPDLIIGHDHQQDLQDLEAAHFRRLFQLLIRRSFLFSFGYADCLKTEPYQLRDCLDDTFSIVVKMETTVRGALDEQLIHELSGINERLSSKVGEACVSVSGIGGAIYGAGSCDAYMGGDLGAFFITPATILR